jgi:hypothetical protein
MKYFFEQKLKNALRWENRTDDEKRLLRRQLEKFKYYGRNLIATTVCCLPIPLTTLLRLSGSDKHQPNGHLYGYAYARIFSRFRYRPIKILEIGIGGYGFSLGGQSLTAWQAYFPFGKVVACDIEDRFELQTFGTKIYKVDQSSKLDLDKIKLAEGRFDIIIDDGSHLSKHQIFTFLEMFDSLKDGGIYVIEDTMTSFWSFSGWDGSHIDSVDFCKTCIGYFMAITPYLNADEFETDRAVDPDLVKIAGKIGSIQFEKNLVIIERREGSKGETAITRLRAATNQVKS